MYILIFDDLLFTNQHKSILVGWENTLACPIQTQETSGFPIEFTGNVLFKNTCKIMRQR